MLTNQELTLVSELLTQHQRQLQQFNSSSPLGQQQQQHNLCGNALSKINALRQQAEQPATSTATHSTHTNILIAEDDQKTAQLLQTILQELEADRIDIARDGEQALNMLQQQDYALVLCDWDMPKKSGLEVLEAMRQQPNLSATAFILVTAISDIDSIRTAIKAGVSHYIPKPIDANFVLSQARELLKAPTPRQYASADA